MKWIGSIVFSKSFGNSVFGQIFGHQRAKNEARNTKMNRGQETHPIRVNARYEMNWANSFLKKYQKPSCLQTDGWMDRHRGESSIPQFHLRWSGGIMKGLGVQDLNCSAEQQTCLKFVQNCNNVLAFILWYTWLQAMWRKDPFDLCFLLLNQIQWKWDGTFQA